MCALLCWCALAVGGAVGSLHENGPLQADEPPIMRGMRLQECLLRAGKSCSRPMELNVVEGYEVKFLFTGYLRTMGFSICRRMREL